MKERYIYKIITCERGSICALNRIKEIYLIIAYCKIVENGISRPKVFLYHNKQKKKRDYNVIIVITLVTMTENKK